MIAFDDVIIDPLEQPHHARGLPGCGAAPLFAESLCQLFQRHERLLNILDQVKVEPGTVGLVGRRLDRSSELRRGHIAIHRSLRSWTTIGGGVFLYASVNPRIPAAGLIRQSSPQA